MRAHVRRAVALAVAAFAVVAAGCSSDAGGGKSSDQLTIAFLMPCSACADRFEQQDKPLFIQAVHAIDPQIKVIANNAEGSSATQISQTESALTNGADVIVVSPLDESAGAAIVDKATAASVDNGAGQVPSVLLNPVVVDKGNIAATVLADGFTTKAKLCTGDVTDKCPI